MNKAAARRPRQVKFSIFAQCAVIIAAAVTIVAATVTTSSFVQTRQIAFAGLLTKAEAVTRSIAAPAGGAIRFARSEGLVQEIDLLYTAAGGQAVAAVVTDAAGSRIVAGGPGLGAHASDLAALAAEAVATGRGVTDGARFLVAEPVRFGADGEVVGAVAIAWSTDAMSGALARARYEVLGLAALALGTALAGGILLLRRSVTQPLREIGRAMKRSWAAPMTSSSRRRAARRDRPDGARPRVFPEHDVGRLRRDEGGPVPERGLPLVLRPRWSSPTATSTSR
jgi:methyl-accepting chemotaxis protein